MRELEDAIRAELGQEWRVRVEVVQQPTEAQPLHDLRQQASEDPLVRELQQLFGARIIKVEPNAHEASAD